MKKFLPIVLLLILLLPMQKTQAQQIFTDLPTTHDYFDEIMYLLEKNVISPSSTFGLNDVVTREEVAVMVAKAKGLNGAPRETRFSDVPKSNPNSGYIQAAYEARILGGYPDGTFKPNDKVTRGQMAVFIANAFDLPAGATSFKDVRVGQTGYDQIKRLVAANVTSGYPDGTFKPNNNLTRAHISLFLYRAMDYAKVETKSINYQAIKIDGKLYGLNHLTGFSETEMMPYLPQFYELKLNEEKHLITPSLIDVRKYSEDTYGTQSGLFNILQIVTGAYKIVPSNNPFLDGNIQLTNSYNNWTTTNKDLVNSDLKLGFESVYQSASNITVNEWYEYKGKAFRSPKNYINGKEYFENNGIRFSTLRIRFNPYDLNLFINDLLGYWGINKEISYGYEGDLTYIEIKSKK